MDLVTSGWLNVYKPSGISSSSTVLKIKRNFKLKKIGHGGTLDPEAEGILPIAFGYTTKILSFVENSYKKYNFIIKWGQQTTTDDSEGKVIFTSSKIPKKYEINEVLPKYIGRIKQKPPKYSAIKINGNRAYKLSRKNVVFQIPSRIVSLYEASYKKNNNYNESIFSIKCGKGFYVRSFARDIAIDLGTRGHVIGLKRQEVGFFNKKNSILLDDLLKISHLTSGIKGFYHSSVVLDDIPALTVNNAEMADIRMGKKINTSLFYENSFKEFKTKKIVYAKNKEELVALGYIENNFFKPKKVFVKEKWCR